ncbi:YkvA family protein [Azospirillum picis]|uniref:Uncharacterized membrane protein YkvA (DUF1232 family) n=1 Tax=Azospirillum picis TaxID=488438 RepID=A0ABU0MNL8_9PROT|nr:uncharacterized membrane protein YkvA (DUF1232 family) [Azospirillum picis]MDQ0534798.1 uncharacterized membrane protein YkvA (DUF1232 family) [Azospirillum picis]
MDESSSLLTRAKRWARTLKRDVIAISLAAGDPRTPWPARLVALCVVAYALSPIDLIPDFVPVLGYLDDLIIVPLGILLAIRLIPPDVMTEHRAAAEGREGRRPASYAGAAFILAVWLAAAAGLSWWFAKEVLPQ